MKCDNKDCNNPKLWCSHLCGNCWSLKMFGKTIQQVQEDRRKYLNALPKVKHKETGWRIIK